MEHRQDIVRNAYEIIDGQLRDKFESSSRSGRIEIEILPSSLVPVHLTNIIQVDGPCIAIPKQLIALAFTHARQMFSERCASSQLPVALGASVPERRLHDCNNYARLMLVFDPEINSATNFRKKSIIKARMKSPDASFDETVMREMRLLDSLLTSPLPRHTKSPNLWFHRFWLLSTYEASSYRSLRIQAHQDVLNLNTGEIILSELTIVHLAGERHPKNYYAFNYARKLVKLLLKSRFPGTNVLHVTEQRTVLRSMIRKHHEWCLQHLSDCSGWAFLKFLLESHDIRVPGDTRVAFSTISLTLSRVSSLNWTGQSVWNLLKTAISQHGFLTDFERHEMRTKVELLLSDEDATSSTKSRIAFAAAANSALVWIRAQQNIELKGPGPAMMPSWSP